MQNIAQSTMKQPWEAPQSTQKITPDPALKVPEVWRFFDFLHFFSGTLPENKCKKSKKRRTSGTFSAGSGVIF